MICKGTIVNMPDEMFNDALFYRERMSDVSNSRFDKWRYARTSIIYFCCAVESWINKTIAYELSQKSDIGTEDAELLKRLQDPNESEIPKLNGRVLYTPVKLKIVLPKILEMDSFDAENEHIEKYLNLAKLRNIIIHYAPKNFEEVYNDENIEQYVEDAPDIVENLIKIFYPNGGMPTWFSKRQSRQIM